MNVHICYFSGSVAELKPKQKGNDMIVLDVLSRDPNVSAWDMDDNKKWPLWKAIDRLQEKGYIKSIDRPYPWLKFEVTKNGQRALSEFNK